MITEATGNRLQIQTFAQRLGALNLTHKLEKEQDPELKDAALSSLYNLLKG